MQELGDGRFVKHRECMASLRTSKYIKLWQASGRSACYRGKMW